MTLAAKINADIAASMKARDAARLSALRMMKAAITNKGVEKGRDLDDGESGLPEINNGFVRSDCNPRLAKHTFYTHERTPEQTRDAILALLEGSSL